MAADDSFLRVLAELVFGTPERWGWEYREPPPPRPSPELAAEPLWYEPPAGSGLGASSSLSEQQRAGLPRRIAICVGLLFVGVLLRNWGIVLDLIALVLAGIWFLPPLFRARSAARGAASGGGAASPAGGLSERDRAWAQYSAAWASWRSSVQSWNTGEQVRVAQADLWHPVIAAPRTSRVDVFGGVPDGWAALLTTMGASSLQSGNSVLILDLTEHDLSRELLELAGALGRPASALDLPAGLDQADLLHGLAAEDVAEIIAEAVHSLRDAAAADIRGTDADVVRAVVDRLDGEPTFRAISAGLQVLRRSYDASAEDPALTVPELQRLSDYAATLGGGDQLQQQLRVLAGNVELLAGRPAAGPPGPATGFWPAGAMVIRTADRNPRRKDFMDRVLVQILIHHLRLRPARESSDVLFVAGCDHLGLRALETLTRQAKRSGLRTVLILEHLRDDVVRLLGGSDSASVIMRMGNVSEATAAAEFIGRGNTFVMNQVTRQLGDAATQGQGTQWGAGATVSESTSRERAGLGGSRSRGVSRADSWSRTVNWSTTTTRSESQTFTRAYEFTVEPTQIQGMPPTAFMFVEATDGRRRVIAGDCNPAVSMLDRVAGQPRLAGGSTPPVPIAGPAGPAGPAVEPPTAAAPPDADAGPTEDR